MPDVMKVLAKEDPFVPSVFEIFKEASTSTQFYPKYSVLDFERIQRPLP